MNIKKFLKPDWKKIAIFILIIILDSLIYYFLFCSYIGRPAVYFCKFPIISLPNYFKSGCDDAMINGTLVNKYNFISWRCDKPTYSEYMNYTYFENCGSCDSILNILYFPINLIYQYILSCLIVWLYDKVKKK